MYFCIHRIWSFIVVHIYLKSYDVRTLHLSKGSFHMLWIFYFYFSKRVNKNKRKFRAIYISQQLRKSKQLGHKHDCRFIRAGIYIQAYLPFQAGETFNYCQCHSIATAHWTQSCLKYYKQDI